MEEYIPVVGDRVRFKTEDELRQEFGYNGREYLSEAWINPDMSPMFGKEFMIKSVEAARITGEIPVGVWSDEATDYIGWNYCNRMFIPLDSEDEEINSVNVDYIMEGWK